MAYNALNNLIDAYIYANGVQAITGQILNGVLKQMVSQLGSGYHLMGVAGPETVPASNDYAMAYFAATAGEYTDFGGITLAAGEVAVLLTYGNGSWEKQTIYNVPTGTADLENTANFITNAVTDLVNYYTKTEIDTTLANYPTLEDLATALADYYTETEIDTILAGYTTNTALASALADYYNKNDIDGLLSVVNAALADRYTKSETDTKLADYYKKTETYDKDEVDSIVATLSRQEYIVAWDGLTAPDVSAIPAGVTVTYSGTPYTGTLAASASTVNKIYMVWNGVAYDMYGTSQDGGYSWVPMGTTSVDLSQYATKAEVSQLEAKVTDLDYHKVDIATGNLIDPDKLTVGYGLGPGGVISSSATLEYSDYIPVDGKDIASSAWASSIWPMIVYDRDKNYLRDVTTQQYTYQAGDYYVRMNFWEEYAKPMANYGTVLNAYTKYNPIGGYIEEIQDSVENKVDANNPNLVDADNIIPGKGVYSNSTTGSFTNEATLCLTDLIPVRGKNIISNSITFGSWASFVVYKEDESFIRVISGTQQYTFVEGDYYVRICYLTSETQKRANYGTALNDYAPYNPIGGYLNDVYNSIDEVNSGLAKLDIEKVDNGTVNLIQSFTDEGKMISANGSIVNEATGHITDYIAVNGRDIVSNAWHSSYWSAGNVYDANKQYLRTIGNTGQYTYQSGDYYIRLSFQKINETPIANYGTVLQPYSTYNPIRKYREDIDETLAKIDTTFDVASGERNAYGTYESELKASPVENNKPGAYIGFVSGEREDKRASENLNIMAVNHDDLQLSDYIGSRKIYNKYGFNANFNFILLPFSNKDEQTKMVENVRKLVADGNDLGLHAIMNKSYWWMNKAVDIRPDSSFSFAPTLQDIQGSNQDHTGTNEFGDNITNTTAIADIGFNDLPTSELRQLKVVDMTASDMLSVVRCFSIYGDYQYTVTGLDLNGNTVTKTVLQWLEYWYNNLIDDSLGYSSEETAISAKYSEDYSGNYPSVAEILGGNITSTGVFTKGLFKGCKTCCNWEVTDRCIDVATAFVKHYFGVNKFTNFGRHGVGYFSRKWRDEQTGFIYEDAGKNILTFEGYKTYNTRTGCFESEFDVLLKNGIRMTNHGNPLNAVLEGQVGLYFGQKNTRADFFTHAVEDVGGTGFWNFFGTNVSEDDTAMPYADFSAFLNGQGDWLKFAVENAGKTLTRNGKTFKVFDNIKRTLYIINACKGTGIVPFFTMDTIKNNPSIMTAIDLILRYCYTNNIQVVPVEKAREIASSRKKGTIGNLFPNGGFNQSLLTYFKGTDELICKLPDGWHISKESDISDISVNTQVVDGTSLRTMSVEVSDTTTLYTKIYGLAEGRYNFSFFGKSDNADGAVSLYVKHNGDYILKQFEGINRYNAVDIKYLNSVWTLYEIEFEIAPPHKNPYDGTDAVNVICQGYEDNVANITVELYIATEISIAKPTLKLI